MELEELKERLSDLLERQAEYPQCEHISKEIDRVLEQIGELEE